ncbi:methyl-accepting chemotaxis protein [Bermanella sp. WJH001]|uniref:methyl-accepting chemotaxis protein n=1 Tax=Bermanella sp. WJH001 TaxID=3048005 RepID=UPI0024BD8EB0|nr:HAMP domain-containing methyl-accepting chemotaxis protein [Bermanella sp. WJH001]MDJ1538453.1 HAMP domain-containing methyl-accepting chemotaxis protein [Bermanella sp. WJH001]
MAIFSKLPLKYKILSIALISALGFASYIAYHFKAIQVNDQRLERIQKINYPALEAVGVIWLELFAARSAMQEAISESELSLIEKAKEHQKTINTLLEKISGFAPQYTNVTQVLNKKLANYMTTASKLTVGIIDGEMPLNEIRAQAKNMNADYNGFSDSLKEFRTQAHKDFAERLDQAKQESRLSLTTGMIIAVIILGVICATSLIIANGITSNLNRIIKELEGMSTGKGDLTVRLETSAQDEIGTLVNRFNAFATHLQLMIKVLANLALGVTKGTEEVQRIAQHTREGIENQQGKIHQVATAITQMAQTSVEVSSNAGQASDATQQANTESQSSQQIVHQSIEGISTLASNIENAQTVIQALANEVEKIASASQDIGNIAEQTNLLALNAAIEAARAGEQGRGFAVVADEVRTLAGRTAESTSEIGNIVQRLLENASQAVDVMEQSKNQAENAVNQSKNTGVSLESILRSIATINQMNDLVSTSAKEQSNVAEEVSENIVRINSFSEQTVDNAQATAQATQKLSEQAEQLKAIVNEFKV